MMRGEMFKAKVTRVIGPDLFEADIDLGFDTRQIRRLKLAGVDSEHVRKMHVDESRKAMDYLRTRIEEREVILRVLRKGEHFYARLHYGPEESDILNEMVNMGLLRRFEKGENGADE